MCYNDSISPFSIRRNPTMEDIAKQHIATYFSIMVDEFNKFHNTNIETEIYIYTIEDFLHGPIIGIDITIPGATIGINATFAVEKLFTIELEKEFIYILDTYI